MLDQLYVYAIAAVIIAAGLFGVFRKSFDPFAPHWLFLAGFAQVYIVQAISYREYAVRVRGLELVTAANARALWALSWFLLVYFSGIGRVLAARLPKAPSYWSTGMVVGLAPPLVLWGLICAGLALSGGNPEEEFLTPEAALFRSFAVIMLVGGILLMVTGRDPQRPRPALGWAGVIVVAAYVLIWVFRGRRTPPLFGVLGAVCAYYTARWKRPSKAVLALTALASVLVVTIALGFRNQRTYERSIPGFLQFVADFDAEMILTNLNLKGDDADKIGAKAEETSHETEEYCGYLLMMDTVPAKSEYDYGQNYLRLVSTFIPRIVWPDKPYYGREQWVNAWIAGSEFKRKSDFTGPAISLLGATQLNGGAWATVIVMAILALLLRTGYEYFRLYAAHPWAQAWWALTYYNAWLMTVNDDPFVWFYYIYGFTVVPPMLFLWIYHRLAAPAPGMAGLQGGNGGEGLQTAGA